MNLEWTNELKPIVYYLKENQFGEKNQLIYQSYTDRFQLPLKIYGDYEKTAYHIFQYYLVNQEAIGCFFHGEAGAGKSLLSEIICNLGIDHGMPVIYVRGLKHNADYDIINTISNIRNCIVYFDEFGKMFNTSDQNRMLGILDKKNTKNIWIITDNDDNFISSFIGSRPGRMRYNIEFNKLEEKGVAEFCKDNQMTDSFIEDLLRRYTFADKFTFDHLQAIVSEARFKIDVLKEKPDIDEMCKILNVKSVLTKYIFRVKSVHYLEHLLEDGYYVTFRCKQLYMYDYVTDFELSVRDIEKLFSNSGMIKVTLRVMNLNNEIFKGKSRRSEVVSLHEHLIETSKSGIIPEYHIPKLTTSVQQEAGQEGLNRYIVADDQHFTVRFGIFTKDGNEVFL